MQFEQLIYGTFPDLPGSQQVVYRSSGITPELEGWLIQQYDQFGDCKTEEFRSSLTLQWHRESEVPIAALTKVTHAGQDFSGRWGALLRHSALITQEQFFALSGDISGIAAKLVSGGTSEELTQSRELEIDCLPLPEEIVDQVLALDVALYHSNLRRILAGERLIVYADLNTQHLNDYIRNLLILLPLPVRSRLNWSEFIFHARSEIDVSVVHSSRYAAPEGDIIEFQGDGENAIGDVFMTLEQADEYLATLSEGIQEKTGTAVSELLFAAV